MVSIEYSIQRDPATGAVCRVSTLQSETEANHSVSIYIAPEYSYGTDLNHEKIVSFLNFRFKHLNPFFITDSTTSIEITEKLEVIERHISTRLRRVQTWSVHDSNLDEDIDSMYNRYNTTFPSQQDIAIFTNLTSQIVKWKDVEFECGLDDDSARAAINKWDFNAFQYNIDELLYIGIVIFQDYFKDKESARDELASFLSFTRDNYRIGNPFHNFRHAIDVLQATYFYLKVLKESSDYKISEFESFTLLLSSLGHDIGHPGITNAFLSKYESPLSKEFPTSLLENYHLLKFKKILLPFIDQCINNDLLSVKIDKSKFSNILESSIIATDMAKHDEFVSKISELETKFDNFQLLACILIKCADISNVCRTIDTSCRWGLSLNEEFKQISRLEAYNSRVNGNRVLDIFLKDDLEIKPVYDVPLKKIFASDAAHIIAKNQMFFITVFANAFFTKVSNSIPHLQFLKEHLQDNADYWNAVIEKNSI